MLARTARSCLVAVFLLALAACGSTSRPVGTSTGGEAPASVAAIDAGTTRVSLDFRTRLKKFGDRFESKGHAPGRWDADVYMNPEAEQAWSTDSPFAAGAELVMEHVERQGEKGAGPVMAMKKSEGGAWTFSVVSARGEAVTGRALENCAACHKDAPRDHVFSVAR